MMKRCPIGSGESASWRRSKQGTIGKHGKNKTRKKEERKFSGDEGQRYCSPSLQMNELSHPFWYIIKAKPGKNGWKQPMAGISAKPTLGGVAAS